MKMEFLMDEIQVQGEIVELRDEPTQSWAVVKATLPNDAVYEVPFRPVDRDLVCRGYVARPLLLLQVTGRVEPRRGSFVFAQDRTIKLVEHTRFSELLNVQIRLGELLYPHPKPTRTNEVPTEDAQACASAVLCRLLAEHPNLPVPRLFPAEDRGVIAVWPKTELTFGPNGREPNFYDISRFLRGVQ